MARYKVKWVDSKEVPPEVEGVLEGDTIILVKGKATSLTREHEKAHFVLGHGRRKESTPGEFVGDELDAELYTYRKLGKPLRLIRELRAYLLDLVELWNLPLWGALRVIENEMDRRRRKIPKAWRRDYEILREGVRRGEERRFGEEII